MNEPLHFCFCTSFYPPFSRDADGLYVHHLANALAEQGHSITVIHCPDAFEALHGQPLQSEYSDHANVTIQTVSAGLGKLGLLAAHQTGYPVGMTAQLKNALRGPFDVIHFHNVSLLGGPAVFAYGESKIKLGSINDHWLICPMHLLWKYTGDVCDRPQCFRCSIRQGRPPQLWRSSQHMASSVANIDLFLGPSVFTIRKHLERGFSRPMVHLPPLHRPPENFVMQSEGLANETLARPYFFCAGRLEDYKGFQDVIPVFRQFTDHDLVISGQGSFRPELEALAAGIPNVRVIGECSAPSRHALYREAVATIVPSRCFQTFCHSTVESFAAGTPVVAFRRSAVEEIISEHGGGILYTNEEELRAAIASLIGDQHKWQELKARTQDIFGQEYSASAYTQRYLHIVHELRKHKMSGLPVSCDPQGSGTFADRPLFGV